MYRESWLHYGMVLLVNAGLIIAAIHISLTIGVFDISIADVFRTIFRNTIWSSLISGCRFSGIRSLNCRGCYPRYIVFCELNLNIKTGKITTIIGPNGCANPLY